MTKYLDQVRLKVERHPHFAFFRNGKHCFCELCVLQKHSQVHTLLPVLCCLWLPSESGIIFPSATLEVLL